MRSLERTLIAFCLLLLPPSTLLAADQKPATPQYTSVRRLAENVTLAMLDNGLTVIVQENHTAPVATVRCYVKNTGSAFEGRYLGVGLSHVLEHVVSGGTTIHHTEKEIETAIARFGGVTNAYTTNDHTTFFIDCPARNAMTAIELTADAMQHITFEPKEFARELKVVRRELADDEVDRPHVLNDVLDLTVYAVHPARHPVIGYLPVLNGTTNQTIIDFYHERYVPNNQIFVVVGDVKTAEVLEHVARQWAGTPRGRETFIALPEEPEQVAPREAVREMEGTVYDFAIAWPTVTLSQRDMYALDLAAYILGEGESSRLVRQLKYDHPLVLSVAAASNTPHFVRGYFVVTAAARPETWEKAAAEIVRQVYRLRDEEIGAAELAKAKKQKAAELVFQRQTVQQQAESLGISYLGTSDPLFDRTYTERIQAVTAAEIRAAARKYFVASRMNRVIIAPPGGGPKGAAESQAGEAGTVRLVRLPNGVRVLTRRVPNLPLVNIQAYALGGSSLDGEKHAGQSMLLAELLGKGTQGMTGAEIADYFDSVGGVLSFSAGRFTLSGGATCLRDDFPKAAGIFADCFLHPAIPQDQFDKIQSLLLADIENRSADPHAEIGELYFDSLPDKSPYHVNPTGKAETVKALTVADLKKLHAECITPDAMVVTVFGDIDPDAAVALVKEHFGGLLLPSPDQPSVGARRGAGGEGGQVRPSGAASLSNRIAESKVVNKVTNKDTAMLILAFACEGIHDREDHAAMIVLRAILNGYSTPGGWLHNELRGEGLVYYVQTSELTGPEPGYFIVTSQTRPDKLDEVVARIRRNLDRAREGKIPEDEFHTAIEQIVGLHAQENVTIGEQARTAAIDELYGLGYDYDKKFDDQIRAVTLKDVVRVAEKYFTKSVLVTTSPEKK